VANALADIATDASDRREIDDPRRRAPADGRRDHDAISRRVTMTEFAWLALSGMGVGLMVGLTGVGGGSLMTPLLITAFGIPAPVAVGTDLAFAAVTKTAATFAHRAARTIREPVVILLAAGSVPAAIATLAILANISATPQGLARVIRLSVAIAVLVSVALLVLRGSIRRWALHSAALDRVRRHRPAATVVAGALIGAAVALTSLGAGAIGAAILSLLYPEFEPAEIAGSDIAHAVPLTAIAAAGHAWLGTIDAGLLLALITGGLPGIVAGSIATRSVPTHVLRILLIGALGLAAMKLLV
jgi:uncharacterized membrane protein YfcA